MGKHILHYDSMLVLAHFKGHPMGGYGGALKQLAIGCASRAGKALIHSAGKTDDRFKTCLVYTSGITVLFVTHDIAEALKLGTRTLVMDAGQIQQYDAPSRLLAHPATSFVERLVRRSRVFQTRA